METTSTRAMLVERPELGADDAHHGDDPAVRDRGGSQLG